MGSVTKLFKIKAQVKFKVFSELVVNVHGDNYNLSNSSFKVKFNNNEDADIVYQQLYFLLLSTKSVQSKIKINL